MAFNADGLYPSDIANSASSPVGDVSGATTAAVTVAAHASSPAVVTATVTAAASVAASGGSTGSPTFGEAGTWRADTNPASSTPAFAVPANVASGDIVVIHFRYNSSGSNAIGTITPPSGFENIMGAGSNSPIVSITGAGSDNRQYFVFWKRATAADTGTYSFSWTGTATVTPGVAVRYTGGAPSGNPWDDTPGTSAHTSATTTRGPVSISPASTDTLLIFGQSNQNTSGGDTAPSGFSANRSGSQGQFALFDKAQAASGTSGSLSGSTNSSIGVAYVLALRSTASTVDVAATTAASATVTASVLGAVTRTTTAAVTAAAAVLAAGSPTTTATVTATAGTGAAAVPTTVAAATVAAQAASPAAVTHTTTAGPSATGTTDSVLIHVSSANSTVAAAAVSPAAASPTTTPSASAAAVSAYTPAATRTTTAAVTVAVGLSSPGNTSVTTVAAAAVVAEAPGVITGYRAVIPITSITARGDVETAVFSPADTFNGNRFLNRGTSVVVLRNTSPDPVNATFRWRNPLGDGRTITVPAGGEITTAVWPYDIYTQDDGACWVDFDSGTGVEIAVLDMYPAW